MFSHLFLQLFIKYQLEHVLTLLHITDRRKLLCGVGDKYKIFTLQVDSISRACLALRSEILAKISKWQSFKKL